MDIIPFVCPSCGGETYSVAHKVESYNDFLGAICKGCGHVMTDDDIKGQAHAIAIKLAKEAFKRGGA